MDNTSVGKRLLHTLQLNSISYTNLKDNFILGDIMLEIKLNNKNKKLQKNYSIIDLVKILDLNPNGIVIEVNLKIIKKEKWGEVILNNGDSVEIITFMGGG